jgi:hypothetical protein
VLWGVATYGGGGAYAGGGSWGDGGMYGGGAATYGGGSAPTDALASGGDMANFGINSLAAAFMPGFFASSAATIAGDGV